MVSISTRMAGAAGALVLAATLATPAQAQSGGVRAGVLSCNVSSGIGFVITSSRALGCVYRPARGRAQYYAGTVRRYGVDIGFTGRGRMEWGVLTAQRGRMPVGALAGQYVGASAAATVGVGVGANALVGGNNRAFTLQPISVEGQTGLSLAAGVGEMLLEPVEPPRRR